MEKKQLLGMISSPLTMPYFDIDAFHGIEPAEARYAAAVAELVPAEASALGLPQDHVPAIVLAQYQAGKYLAMRLKEIGISQVEVADRTGIGKTVLSKYIQGKRPLSPNGELLTPLCYSVLGESCHKVMFGIKGQIHLPNPYSAAAWALHQLSDEKRETLCRLADTQLKLYHKQNPSEIQYAPHRGISDVIGERIRELIYDKGVVGFELLGKDTPYQIRAFLRQFYLEAEKKEYPRLGILMYLALETGQALDYFIAEDFTRYTDCYYSDGDSWIQIEDMTILRFIGICASVTQEQRIKLLGTAIGTALGLEFAKKECSEHAAIYTVSAETECSDYNGDS